MTGRGGMAGSRLCRPFAVPPCRMARREWQESMGNTECVHIMSLCKQNTGRETVEIHGSGPVGFCGKLGRPLRREADSVWKTLWKMFITYCTRKLLGNLCELAEQKDDREGYRSHPFSRGNFANFVEFFRSGEPAGTGPSRSKRYVLHICPAIVQRGLQKIQAVIARRES